jgi:hypothetical protein
MNNDGDSFFAGLLDTRQFKDQDISPGGEIVLSFFVNSRANERMKLRARKRKIVHGF